MRGETGELQTKGMPRNQIEQLEKQNSYLKQVIEGQNNELLSLYRRISGQNTAMGLAGDEAMGTKEARDRY